jgi:hypothetical protein
METIETMETMQILAFNSELNSMVRKGRAGA